MDYLSQLLSSCKDSYWNSSKKHQRCIPLIMYSYDARDNLLFDKDLQTLKGGLLITGFSQSGKKEHWYWRYQYGLEVQRNKMKRKK